MSIREGKERLLKQLEEQEATRKRQWQPVNDRIADLEHQLSATQAQLASAQAENDRLQSIINGLELEMCERGES